MRDLDEAIILAGGLGTRLWRVLDNVPKPLAPVAGRPFLAWLLDALASQGLRRAVLATGYLGDQIENVFGKMWRGVELSYSREAKPLGTGGAIALALRQIKGDACFVLNGDTWLELDYQMFDAEMHAEGCILGVALARVPDVARYGAVHLDRTRVVEFAEKGSSGPGYINAGVYRIECSLADGFPAADAFSFERDVLVPTAQRGGVAGFMRTEGFIDIGVPEDFIRAQTVFRHDQGAA